MRIAELLRAVIDERGPLNVAAFMDIALYDPGCGYYARAAQRSGRAGDFFTSVDVGSLFGELVERQIAEMADVLAGGSASRAREPFDLVEAGAGNGRLSADILRAARRRDPDLYRRIRLHLIEGGAAPRAAQPATLGEVADRLHSSTDTLPERFDGVLIANELIDALPVHQVVMRPAGLREVFVDWHDDRFVTREGPLSTPALSDYLERLRVRLEPGWRAEINLRAVTWIAEVARRLGRGFVVLIDYGHGADELYSPTHAGGTLTTFARQTMAGPESRARTPAWLANPGEQDITAHVDFTSLRAAGEAAGLMTLGFLDQTYFLMGILIGPTASHDSAGSRRSEEAAVVHDLNARKLRALKTLLMPGGLGSTHKVLILGKDVGAPVLIGCSYRMRIT